MEQQVFLKAPLWNWIMKKLDTGSRRGYNISGESHTTLFTLPLLQQLASIPEENYSLARASSISDFVTGCGGMKFHSSFHELIIICSIVILTT